MLKKSKEKLLNTAELSLGDAEHLPYEHGKFDLPMCTDNSPPKNVKWAYHVRVYSIKCYNLPL
jgi:hypothetical protein